jgi:prepilin-type N-terminal cleavage/methylation domain-containing protein
MKGNGVKNQKGFTFIEFLIVIAILGIVGIMAGSIFYEIVADEAFQNEFGLDRHAMTPEESYPVLQKQLNRLCAQYRSASAMADESWLVFAKELDGLSAYEVRSKFEEQEVQAQILSRMVQREREHYELAYKMAVDNGFIQNDPNACRPDVLEKLEEQLEKE